MRAHLGRAFRPTICAVALAAVLGATSHAAAATIVVAWDPNSEPDIAGYTVHVGVESNVYTQTFDVNAATTTFSFNGANPGQEYCFAVVAVNTQGAKSAFSDEVCGKLNSAPTLVQPAAQSSVVGGPAALQLTATDPESDPLTFSATGLPSGLAVDAATGLISGTPVAVGSASVTVTAFDGQLTASRTFTWTILPGPLSIWALDSDVPSPQAPGSRVTFTANAAGGTAPYKFKWWVSADGGATWQLAQDWGANSYAWIAGPPGTYQIRVWARNKGATADVAQAVATVGFAIELTHRCFPTCTETDARFLIVPGATGADTFSRNDVVIGLSVPAAQPSFSLGVFDGDTGNHWDQGSVPLVYEIFADPDGDAVGNGSPVFVAFGNQMANNDWTDFTVDTGPSALAPGATQFRYVLVVSNPDTAPFTWSAFKLRTDQKLTIAPQVFAFLAPLASQLDAAVVYPNYPLLTQSTYDGTWDFFMDVPFPVQELAFWDGDMDFGTLDCSARDTDDPNTPNTIPTFAQNSNAAPEGAASAGTSVPKCASGLRPSGNPADDDFGPYGDLYRRSPSVYYEVTAPSGGLVYSNMNPSGNREWEKFSLATKAIKKPDFLATVIPKGVYKVHMVGVDLGNVNAWRFPAGLVAAQRRVRAQIVTASTSHPPQTFNYTIAPGGPTTTFALTLNQNRVSSGIQGFDLTPEVHHVTEQVPSGWTLIGYAVKPDPNGTATCSKTEAYAGASAVVPADAASYLVCMRNEFF